MPATRCYEFARFRLDARAGTLFCDDELVGLTPKAVGVLSTLVEARGRVVTKEELLRTVWPGVIVEEGSVASHVSQLRKVLERAAGGARFIETIPKRGYRFVADVTQVEPAAEPVEGRAMLLVLPFTAIGGSGQDDYFCDGLTEEMICELAKLDPTRLGVIARTTAMRYRHTTQGIQEIARELRVSHVLEGSIRRSGGRVRITAQLARGTDATQLWAESYERGVSDVLAIQVDVAKAIAGQIAVKLTSRQQRRLERESAIAIDALEAHLRGRHLWYRRTEQALLESIACFETAIRLNPDYAAAYAGLADAYTMVACRGIAPAPETLHKAKVLARQAVQCDAELGEGYASLAHVRLHDWDWPGLDAEFRRAIELSPSHAIAYYWYAEYLMAIGRGDDAVARVRQARSIDPMNSVLASSLGMILYLARRHDEAREELVAAIDNDPGHFLLHLRLGFVRQQQGEAQAAVAQMKKAVELSGNSTEALAALAQAYAAADMTSECEAALAELEREAQQRYVSPYNVARIHATRGDSQAAVASLHRAYAEHHPDLIELGTEPVFDAIRNDARFARLQADIGFGQAAHA